MRRLGTISSELSEGLPWRQALCFSNRLYAATEERLIAFELSQGPAGVDSGGSQISHSIRWQRRIPDADKHKYSFRFGQTDAEDANLVLIDPLGIEAIDGASGETRWRVPETLHTQWSFVAGELWGSSRSDPYISSMTLAREGDPLIDSRGRAINGSLCGSAEIRRRELAGGRELPAMRLCGAPRGIVISGGDQDIALVLAGNRVLGIDPELRRRQLFQLPYQPGEYWRLLAASRLGPLFEDPSGEIARLDFQGEHAWTASRRDEFNTAGASLPLITKDQVIQVDHRGQIRALDLESGRRRWCVGSKDPSGYPQLTPILIDERRILVKAGIQSLAEIDLSSGKILEEHSCPGPIRALEPGRDREFLALGPDIYVFGDG